MKIFYSDVHLKHNPPFEIFDGGEKYPHFEVPERAERILAALKQTSWAEILPPEDFGLDPILAVHDADYIDFLSTAYAEWMRSDTDAAYEKTALLPATFPTGKRRRKPKTLLGKAGYYISDLSAPIVAGTYIAALAAANCALSGAKSVLETVNHQPRTITVSKEQSASPALHPQRGASVRIQRSAFALCRPPGHHAGKANCAGYCYINNAAVAANWLSKQGKTAILDIDYHAGNGTQEIFYDGSDVFTISIHADPDFEYPYYTGYADETGTGKGLGYHRSFPLSAGTDDKTYLETLDKAIELITIYQPSFLVISAGMDLFEGDPLGKFKVSREGIRQIGEKIAGLKLPTLIVMEGGYNNEALGENIVALLQNFV